MDAERKVGRGRVHRGLDVRAKGEDVAAVAHGDGEADRRLAVHPEHRLRRIGEAAPDGGDVAEANHASADREVGRQNVLLGPKRARNPDRQDLVAGLDQARRLDDVLRLQRCDHGRPVETEIGELLGRELDEDPLVLRAENLDLRDVGHVQELRADVLDVVAQFALIEAVGGEAVDDAERVAEIVVEAGSDNARGQGPAHVADALADMIPDVRHFLRGRAALQVDEDGRQAGAGEGADEIELGRLLQRALEPLGHLVQRLVDRRSRPSGLHDHGLDDERGVFVATELDIGKDARSDRQNHQIDGDGAVSQRPFGKIEAHLTTIRAAEPFGPGRGPGRPRSRRSRRCRGRWRRRRFPDRSAAPRRCVA